MKIKREELYCELMYAYLDARKNERGNPSQLEFETNLGSNIWDICDKIMRRTWRPSPLICFIIDHPVKREVFAPIFADRVVSHLLFHMVSPIFERTFIYDSYSCRRGKGTLFGIKRAEHHIRSITDNYRRKAYGLTIDISGYFMSLDRKRLLDIVETKLERFRYRDMDGRVLDDTLDFGMLNFLLEAVIMRDPLEGCRIVGGWERWDGLPAEKSLFHAEKGVGIIIGDLMSQLFSNIYLDELDNFIKRSLHIRHYGRYVDDAFILHEDKNILKSMIPAIREHLDKDLGLRLNMKKVRVFPLTENFRFLGSCIRPYRTYARNRTVRSFRRRIRGMERAIGSGTASGEDITGYLPVINSYLGHLGKFRSRNIVSGVLEGSALEKYFLFDNKYSKATTILQNVQEYRKKRGIYRNPPSREGCVEDRMGYQARVG